MSNYLIYLLQVSCVFSSLILFYWVGLRKLTFYTLNRLFLVLIIPVSLLFPMLELDISPLLVAEINEADVLFLPLPDAEEVNAGQATSAWWNIRFCLQVLYWVGFGVSVLLLVLNVFKLFQIKHSSQLISKDKYLLFESNIPSVFSCFNWVFLPDKLLSKDISLMLKHEEAHVRLYHTADLLLTELFLALTWFNPFVYLFRKQLKSVHEFQADEYVLSKGVLKSDYLTAMLESLVSTDRNYLKSGFKSLTIKSRINMMTKDKSNKYQLFKYIFVAPLLAVILTAFVGFVYTEPSLFPIKEGVSYRVTAKFGNMKDPFSKKHRHHWGIDIAAKTGTAIVATGNGKVVKAQNQGNWGNLLVVNHGGGYETWYAHLDGFAVEEGATVRAGEVVGYLGNTGKSTGPHLHYEVHHNGKRVNPEDYFE